MTTSPQASNPSETPPVGAHHAGPEGHERTRRDHAQELAEDYVELIYDLTKEHGEARLVDLADRIGVSHVTANKTIGRLQRDGLVSRKPYRAIFLTEDGKAMAMRSRHRHAIVFRFLCAIGVGEAQARIDAEGIEHHISAITLDAMSRHLSDRGEHLFP
ncbi:MAG: manganese-binding transcriptional regulator MntR [Phycisphaerae bacterium]